MILVFDVYKNKAIGQIHFDVIPVEGDLLFIRDLDGKLSGYRVLNREFNIDLRPDGNHKSTLQVNVQLSAATPKG